MCDSVVSCSICEETLGIKTIICGRCAAKKYGTQPTTTNSAMLEIALCMQRVFTIVNQGAMGKFCDLESDINTVVAQLQQ